jgi:hypothetical protein
MIIPNANLHFFTRTIIFLPEKVPFGLMLIWKATISTEFTTVNENLNQNSIDLMGLHLALRYDKRLSTKQNLQLYPEMIKLTKRENEEERNIQGFLFNNWCHGAPVYSIPTSFEVSRTFPVDNS